MFFVSQRPKRVVLRVCHPMNLLLYGILVFDSFQFILPIGVPHINNQLQVVTMHGVRCINNIQSVCRFQFCVCYQSLKSVLRIKNIQDSLPIEFMLIMVTTKYDLLVGDEVIDVCGGGYLFGQLDSVIGNAQEAYSALRYQRSTFGDISTKINTISTKLPIVSITKCSLLFDML